MTETPLTVRIPIKGTLLLLLDGSEEPYEIGRVTYHADMNIQLSKPDLGWTQVELTQHEEHHGDV